MGCIIVLLLHTLSAAFTLFHTGSLIFENKGNVIAYFDFFNKISVNCGIYIHAYMHWIRLDVVEAFIEAIQISPVIRCCRTPVWKAMMVPGFICTLVLYLTCTWWILIFGIDVSSWNGFSVSAQMAAREMFWWDRNKDVNPWLPLRIVAILGQVIDSLCSHTSLNTYLPVQLYCAYYIVRDFFTTMLNGRMDSVEALALFREYVVLMKKVNAYLGLYVMQYMVMTMTYHSIHLFDMLNSTTIWWKISTYAYVAYVVNFYFLLSLIFIETKKMKKWLWKDRNYLKIPYHQLITIMYDLLNYNYQFGIRLGKFFTTTVEFCGGILAKTMGHSMLIKLAEQNLMSQIMSKS
ncbi:unnamed protein product [Allacma fusca]|uniref:Uncharacterized protein n=1 Tax=Allacma fusca TaxID=39272 RepID=A0A8J2JHK7_9HEXA|nr:unnamed protein product [Allacma fusca]